MDARDVAIQGKSELDPRRYADRLRMIDVLARAFPDATSEAPGPWSGIPHVGIEIQTRWQMRSGRTFPDDSDRARGWWAAVNYTLTVWPFLAAERNFDAVADEHDVRTPTDDRFLVDSEAERAWVRYLETRRAVDDLWRAGELTPAILASRTKKLQSLLWDAHLRSVRVARERFEPELANLPEAERRFARIWGATTVEYLAALNAPTSQPVSGYFNALLPDFVLRGRAIVSPANNLDVDQRLFLGRLREIHRYEQRHDYRLLRSIREAAPRLDDAGFFEHSYRAMTAAVDQYRNDGLAAVLAGFFRELSP